MKDIKYVTKHGLHHTGFTCKDCWYDVDEINYLKEEKLCLECYTKFYQD